MDAVDTIQTANKHPLIWNIDNGRFDLDDNHKIHKRCEKNQRENIKKVDRHELELLAIKKMS